MAKKNNGNGKVKRIRRKVGAPLGTTVVTRYVLQVLANHGVAESEFIKEYDAIPRKRFGGPREIKTTIIDAYKVFRASPGGEADFDKFCADASLKVVTAERYLGRLLREERNAS
jgi:hypothetical protein